MTWQALVGALGEVWTPLSVLAAVVSGLLLGVFLLGWFATNPRYSTGLVPPATVAFLTFWSSALALLVFYAGQTAATYLVGDEAWPRVASRYGLWVVSSGAIAVGTWVRVRVERHRRRTKAHDRAVDELGRAR